MKMTLYVLLCVPYFFKFFEKPCISPILIKDHQTPNACAKFNYENVEN